MAKKTKQDRSFGEIAKSALGGLTQFGVETSRLVGKGAKVAWTGARRVGGTAKVKASETASELKEKASETASELKEKASDRAAELKEKRASASVE
jgi:hypothetical protein